VMAGVEVAAIGAPGARGHTIQKALFDHGLHLKSTGDTLILAPAFVATDAHLDEIFTKIRGVLKTH
jgi:beta-alanine--pyruvate transaminase